MELSRDKVKEIINDDWLLMDDCEGNKNCDVVKELARIALASLELERGMIRRFDLDMSNCDSCGQDCGADMVEDLDGEYVLWDEVLPHLYRYDEYTIPPAPVSVPAAYEKNEDFSAYHEGWNACRAAMLQGAEPVSNRDELPLGYLQGHKDGLEWAAQLAEANHPQTGDWLYDDPIELAKAIRKGPDMPEADGNSPVVADGWVMVPVEPTAEMLQSGISAHYERSQIQIHDRPAPGPMECAYVAMLAAAPQQEAKNV